MRDLIQSDRSRAPARFDDRSYDRSVSPFFTLRREMDRLFEDAFRGFGFSAFDIGNDLGWPDVEVVDRDKEVCVTAELPGLEENDVEIQVEDNRLVLRGEKRTEIERQIALPAEVDDEGASATFRKGVLTITLPKTERARQQTKRIPISP
jgi:HSP20 family protein